MGWAATKSEALSYSCFVREEEEEELRRQHGNPRCSCPLRFETVILQKTHIADQNSARKGYSWLLIVGFFSSFLFFSSSSPPDCMKPKLYRDLDIYIEKTRETSFVDLLPLEARPILSANGPFCKGSSPRALANAIKGKVKI